MRYFIITFILAILLLPTAPLSAYLSEDGLQGFSQAKVIEIHDVRQEEIPGTGAIATVQEISAEILEGPEEGKTVRLNNDYIELNEGQKFFINFFFTPDGSVIYSVRDVDRRAPLLFLTLLFAGVVILFGGKQGFRSLLSLAGSFVVIIFILLPLLLKGYPPVLVSVLVGSLILFVAIFFTHGFNKQSVVALMGTAGAVVLTGILAYISVEFMTLSGFSSDETAFLNISTAGTLDLRGLLLGGIIIGVIGVLDDIAVTQAAVVAELKRTSPKLSPILVYKKAIRVGREHVGALVNTLVLAYAGVSLPLLLLFYNTESSFIRIVNNEIFATEIVRTIVGSIGLVLAVPLTTALAVWILKGDDADSSHGHSHAH